MIESERIQLEVITKDNFPSLHSMYTCQKNMRYISDGKSDWSIEELQEKYRKANVLLNEGIGVYAIRSKIEGEIIGEAGLFNSFNDPNKLELGYIIDHYFWKEGYGSDVAQLLIHYAFNTLHVKEIIARMYARNIASIKISKKCGMTKIGEAYTNDNEQYFIYNIKKLE